MSLTIRLLGPPTIQGDGQTRELPGNKPWALLTYLLLAARPPSRRELTELLWPEADDPLAALRWSLLQVRRALAPEGEVVERDRRLVVHLSPDATVDARLLLERSPDANVVERLAGGELLEGMYFDDAPAFDQWLMLERQRAGSAVRAALRWAATLLARSEPERALSLAQRAIALDPLDDALHELVIDVYVTRGDRAAAESYLERAERTYRSELGEGAPPSIRRPLERPLPRTGPSVVTADVTAATLLDRAEARLAAGDYAGAEDSARRAAAEAAATADRQLEARALVTLAGVLVHSVRGRDREAIGLLTRAAQLASELRDAALASEAAREIGYVSFLAADYGSAEVSLRRAIELANEAGDDVRIGQALTFLGAVEMDRGDLAAAERNIKSALEHLDRAQERRFRSFTLSFLARARLRAGQAAEAARISEEALEQARTSGWSSIRPWILVHLGEAQMQLGDRAAAERTFAEGFALGEEMRDPCWEGLSLRGLARVQAAKGARERARDMLAEAHQRCTRVRDTYWWADAAILTDLVELEGGADPARAQAALRLAERAPMPDLAARLRPFARPATGSADRPRSQTLPQTHH